MAANVPEWRCHANNIREDAVFEYVAGLIQGWADPDLVDEVLAAEVASGHAAEMERELATVTKSLEMLDGLAHDRGR